MSEKNLFEYNGLSVNINEAPASDVLQFLDENEYGTPGRFIYQHTFASQKAGNLKDTYFFTLRKSSRLLGSIAFNRRQLINKTKNTVAFYIRYLTVMPSYRRMMNENTQLKNNSLKSNKKSGGIIKESMQKFFSNAESYLSLEEKNMKYLFYAHIEDENMRSFLLGETFGYEKTGQVETFFFSRIFPKKDKRLQLAREEDHETINALLEKYYNNYSMYTTQNLFINNNYYCFKENDEIVAGLQASVITWKIKNMPGLSGKILLHLLPRIPVLSKMFNPQSFQFITFESIYVKPGYESHLNRLFESVCAEFKIHVALLFADSNSPLNKMISQHVKSGIFRKFNKPMTAGIYVKFVNFTEEEKKAFCSQPAYVSAFDLT
jgi:hypothetical protein